MGSTGLELASLEEENLPRFSSSLSMVSDSPHHGFPPAFELKVSGRPHFSGSLPDTSVQAISSLELG